MISGDKEKKKKKSSKQPLLQHMKYATAAKYPVSVNDVGTDFFYCSRRFAMWPFIFFIFGASEIYIYISECTRYVYVTRSHRHACMQLCIRLNGKRDDIDSVLVFTCFTSFVHLLLSLLILSSLVLLLFSSSSCCVFFPFQLLFRLRTVFLFTLTAHTQQVLLRSLNVFLLFPILRYI